LAGLKAFIWSNLCTRHNPKKLMPRGHHDWPDKRRTRKVSGSHRGRVARLAKAQFESKSAKKGIIE
jgi:hypothetical protein